MQNVILPSMGFAILNAVIVQWLKNEGEPVRKEEPIVEVETDKLTYEVMAPIDGVLLQQLYGVGETVEVNKPLATVGQAGQGPRWTLEIVTPERLRSLLEVREITLRQRFDVLIGEVELTKKLLETVAFEATEDVIEEVEKLTTLLNEPSRDVKNREELTEKRKTLLETVSKEQREVGQYNISRSLRDTQKETYEIQTIIASFRLIRAEMVNNRVFTTDDETRFDGGIVFPLQELVDTDFPYADELIKKWGAMLETSDKPLRNVAMEQQQDIVTQFNTLLKKMATIRDRMVSMESFNETIDILRAILRQQQQIRQETLEEKNKRLKDLLE